MEGNGNGRDIGSFEWLLGKRLQAFQASGAPADDVETLKTRGMAMAAVLEAFRHQRREAGDSGKYTREGLRDVLAAKASESAGLIRRQGDLSILDKQIEQTRTKLTTPTPLEKDEKLINFWRQMELRATYDRMGLSIVDAVTGSLTFDRVKADLLYGQALERGDTVAQEALEQWPGGSPVSPDLISQGQEQRMMSRDPVRAKELTELLRFKEVWSETIHDAMSELKELLPADDDVIARQASGQASGSSAT